MADQDDQKRRLPPRKSSSSMLLSAFARLTNSSRRLDAPSPPLSATNSSASVLATLSDSNGTTQLQSSLVTSSDGHPESSPGQPELDSDPVRKPKRPADTSELDTLVDQLGPHNQLLTRILAAEKLGDYLLNYPVKDIVSIWHVGSQLLLSTTADGTRSGLRLLLACIKAAQLTSTERLFFWNSISISEPHLPLSLRLDALIELTDDGRNLDSIESHIMPMLSDFLKASYDAAVRHRQQSKSNNVDLNNSEEQLFARSLQYTADVIKYNTVLLKDADLEFIIHRLNRICGSTTNHIDISASFNVITQIVVYTDISSTIFQPCLDLLCSVYSQVTAIKEETWSCFKRIMESNLRNYALERLFRLLAKGPTRAMTVQGAFSIISRLVTNKGNDNLPNIALSILAPVINQMLKSNSLYKLEADVLRLYSTVLADNDLREQLLSLIDWADFRETLVHCSELATTNKTRAASGKTTSAQSTHSRTSTEYTQLLTSIIEDISNSFESLNILHREDAVSLFFQLGRSLSDNAARTLVQYLGSRPFLISNPVDDYQNVWRQLIVTFAHEISRPTLLRAKIYDQLANRFEEVQYLPSEIVHNMVILMLDRFEQETDGGIVEILAAFANKVLQSSHRNALFEHVIKKMQSAMFSTQHEQTGAPLGRRPSTSPIAVPRSSQPSICRLIVRHVIRLFLVLMNESASHADHLYQLIQKVAGDNDLEADARICSLKLFFRLRATAEHRVYVAPVSESETIAAVLCRTLETANLANPEELLDGQKEMRNASTGTVQLSKAKSMNIKKPVLPLWFYPGPKGLPQEPSKSPSLIMFSAPPDQPHSDDYVVIKISLWLETIISILQQPNVDWEIYSYVLVHLGAQLKNQTLFSHATPQIQFLRSVLCEQIRSQNFHEPPSYTSLRKADVAICIFHVLTMLISYNAHFAKSEDDEIVKAFVSGIGSWDGTSKWCIHALSVCSHEIPQSIDPLMELILQKLSQLVTQPQIAIHILEFLCSLARLPELYKHFRETEFKLVFGVSFRYLQYVRDQRQNEEELIKRTSIPAAKTKRHSDGGMRELKHQSTESDLRAKARPDDLPQYVYALAYHVITFWFMALKLQERPSYVAWISRSLMYIDMAGNQVVEEQGLVTLDMMQRIAYTDRDETMIQGSFATSADGEVSEKTWIVGMSLMTIQTAGRTGASLIIRRRPSGTKYMVYRPLLTMPPRHQVPVTTGLDAEVFHTSAYVGVLPEDVLQEMYSGLSLATAPRPLSEVPFPLPADDDKVKRAITTFDRNATVDGHKIGIIYVAEGQSQEVDILTNTFGSAAYTDFIDQIGTLVRLKGAMFNTQGLDREGDTDGKYVYCWRDRATEVIFHTTTMMPTDKDNDPGCINKKRHIGNDFVNIIWNDSGEDFKFDTFPSQFNYVYIVITPEVTTTFMAQRKVELDLTQSLSASAYPEHQPNAAVSKLFYKVQVLSAPGFPSISPAAETKMVNAKSLAPFVRLLALNASFFSLVWANREGGEHVSPWRNRLREIKKLRERYTNLNSANTSTASSPQSIGLSGMLHPSLPSRSHRSSFMGSLNDAY